jgi:hypothetical protein
MPGKIEKNCPSKKQVTNTTREDTSFSPDLLLNDSCEEEA